MSAVKYKQYVELMLEQHAAAFSSFRPIHDGYQTNPSLWADQFHQEGKQILDIARDWERRLCYGTEKGKYAQYSAKLAEKFWSEIKISWPMLDQVGIRKKSSGS